MSDLDLSDLEGLKLEKPPGFDPYNPKQNSLATKNGLPSWARTVVSNFYDGAGQKDRRKAFLKRLGFELNPKDGESYRPFHPVTGEPQTNLRFKEIEPGLDFYLTALPKLFDPEGREEILEKLKEEANADIKDANFQLLVADPLIASGMVAGMQGGAALGATAGLATGPAAPVASTIGAGVLSLGGGLAGGMAGSGVARTLKSAIGDLFLDEDISVDKTLEFYEAATEGAFALGGEKLFQMAKAIKRAGKVAVQEGLKNTAVELSRGKLSKELMTDFLLNPENYTEDAVKQGASNLLNMQHELFGTTKAWVPTTKNLKGGILHPEIQDLNRRADLEIQKLDLNRDADFSAEELINSIDGSEQVKRAAAEEFEDETIDVPALNFLKGIKDEILAKTRSKPEKVMVGKDPLTMRPIFEEVTPDPSELTFSQTQSLIRKIRKKAYANASEKVPPDPVLVNVLNELKTKADIAAKDLGSDLADINANRSEILDIYSGLNRMITDGTLKSAFLETGGNAVAKVKVRQTFGRLAEITGIPIDEIAKTRQFQQAVNESYEKGFARTQSGSVRKEATREGLRQAKIESGKFFSMGLALGSVMGDPIGVGTKLGSLGFAKGGFRGVRDIRKSFASPQALQSTAKKLRRDIDKIDLDLEPPENFGQAISRGLDVRRGALRGAAVGSVVAPAIAERTERALSPEDEEALAQAAPGSRLPPSADDDDIDFSDLDSLELTQP